MSQISSPKRERWLKRRGNLKSPGGRDLQQDSQTLHRL